MRAVKRRIDTTAKVNLRSNCVTDQFILSNAYRAILVEYLFGCPRCDSSVAIQIRWSVPKLHAVDPLWGYSARKYLARDQNKVHRIIPCRSVNVKDIGPGCIVNRSSFFYPIIQRRRTVWHIMPHGIGYPKIGSATIT